MKHPTKILILEDSYTDAEIIQRQLLKGKLPFEFHLSMNKNNFLQALDTFSPDVILSDNSLPQFDATEALKITRQRFPHIPFILITGTVSEEFAATIIKLGADDYILKDRMARLPNALEVAWKQRQSEREKEIAQQKLKESEEKYRIFIQRVTDAFIALDKNWCYTYLNKQAGELIHRDPEKMIGKNVWAEFPDVVGSATYLAFNKAMTEQKYVCNIDYYAPFDLWQENHIYPSADGLSVFIRNITERKKGELELRTAYDRLTFHVENTPLGFIEWDNRLQVKHWSKRAEEIFGWTEKEFIFLQKSGFSQVHEEDQPWVSKIAEQLINGEVENNSLQHRNYTKDGRVIWCEWFNSVLKDKNGKVVTILSLVQDVTEKKIAEDELREREEQYRDLVNNISDLICTHDLEGNILSVNRAAEVLTGFKFDPKFKVNIKDLLIPDVKNKFNAYIEEIRKNGIAKGVMKIKTRYGENRVWEYSNSLKTDGLTIPIVRGYARDVTASRKAEKELRQNEERLNEAQAIAHIGNWEIDLVKNVHTWSNEIYNIFGIKKSEGTPSQELFTSFIHPDDLHIADKKMREAFDNLTESSFNFRFIRKDGAIRHGCSEWKFEFNKTGLPLRMYGIVQDITVRVEAEEQLRRSNERFQYATLATSDIIWELYFETRQFLVHEGKEKIFGTSKLLSWQVGVEGEYITEEHRERVKQSFRAARHDPNREFWQEEYQVYSKQHSILDVVNHAIFIRDEKGTAIRAIGAVTDITDKKQLEAELLEQQKSEQIKITAIALEAQEKERNAIGQELHDNVNQILVGSKLLLSMAKNDPGQTQELVASCINNIQDAINENRKIAHVLVAPDFETKSLTDQLYTLIDNMLHPIGVEVQIDTAQLHDEFLNDQQKLAIYRIAQEQCTNIVKYAKAKLAKIFLSTTGGRFKMIISDNGQGMETGKSTTGIGLRNIKGRLSIFNGSAKITTVPGQGFSLEIEIPLEK